VFLDAAPEADSIYRLLVPLDGRALLSQHASMCEHHITAVRSTAWGSDAQRRECS
jgi:hypothetical protein